MACTLAAAPRRLGRLALFAPRWPVWRLSALVASLTNPAAFVAWAPTWAFWAPVALAAIVPRIPVPPHHHGKDTSVPMQNEPCRTTIHNTPAEPVMLTVDGVAKLLACSARSVRRLADQGKVPRPVRIGGMVRWPRATIDQWLADGCPSATLRSSRPRQPSRPRRRQSATSFQKKT